MRASLILPVFLLTLFGCGGGKGSKSPSLPAVCENKTPEWVSDADGNQVKQGQEWSCYPNGVWDQAKFFKGGKVHGTKTYWYENGNKWMEGEYQDGKAHGTHTDWYENGVKGSTVEYQDGKKRGTHTKWHENGQKSSEAFWTKEGELIEKISWDENGELER